jgi:tetratricopeptide (TPR) repeat protein
MRGLAIVLAVVSALLGARAWAQDAKSRQAELGSLLQALKTAPDASVANLIEQRVRLLWAQGGSPAAVLLEARGARDLVDNADKDAITALDAALVIDPDYAAAYADRALARFRNGDVGGAVADIETALQHEPTMFAVFDTLSRIAEARGDWQAALMAWQHVADADPMGQGVAQRLQALQRKAVGEKS